MVFINYNGRILPADEPLFSAKHRGLRYGDGLFETLLLENERAPLLPLHMERLLGGMKVLGFECPAHFSANFFEKEIQKLSISHNTARIRLSIFRKEGGLYTPQSDEVDFLLEWSPVSSASFSIPQSGFLPQYPLSPNLLSPYKTTNALPYILASRVRKSAGWEEGILLNQEGRVADGCYSNVFVVKNGCLLSPLVREGALAGVMRSVLIQTANLLQVPVEIRPLLVSELIEADEIWFSNAVRGIRWVQIFENRRLKNSLWHEFFQKIEVLWKDGDFSSFQWHNQ